MNDNHGRQHRTLKTYKGIEEQKYIRVGENQIFA